ncbi:hypothetical protein CsSME_00047945 [Camellia sinensis var. sinensis]
MAKDRIEGDTVSGDHATTARQDCNHNKKLVSSINDRRKEQSTRKPANQSSRCCIYHFRLDSSLFIDLNTSDITGGLETCQQFRWLFGQMLSTYDQLQEKDDAWCFKLLDWLLSIDG